MRLFDMQTFGAFEDGRWAGGLSDELEEDHLRERLHASAPVVIMSDWKCKARLWQATHVQWVQFEPNGHVGPFFRSGKPAVMSTDKGLYAGYYVERGLLFEDATRDERERGQVMDKTWHWHPFWYLLTKEPQQLFGVFTLLPAENRCIWVCISTSPVHREHRPFYPNSPSEFAQVVRHIPPFKRGLWIDLIVGVELTKKKCEELDYGIVPELVQVGPHGEALGPLAVARQFHELVTTTVPPPA